MFWVGLAFGFLSGTACGVFLPALVRAARIDEDDRSKMRWVAEPRPRHIPWQHAVVLTVVLVIIVYGLIVLFF